MNKYWKADPTKQQLYDYLPSNHTGIGGDDQADKEVRSTLNIATERKFKIPYTGFKMKISKYILKQRQQR